MLTRLSSAHFEIILFHVWSEGVYSVNGCFHPNCLSGQFGFILLDHNDK